MTWLKQNLSRLLRDRRGATAIEAAICLPVIIMMILAILQYGLFYNAATNISHDFQQASREVKLMENPTQSQLLSLYQGKLSTADANNVTLTVQRVTRFGEEFAQVDMTYAYTVAVPFLDQYPLTSTYQNLVMIAQDS